MADNILIDTRIVLGVTGSIACYKAVDLASKLTQAGAQVDVILTSAAEKFITPLTFQSVTGRRAFTDPDLWGSEGHVQHIGLGKQAELLVIAPASANTLAKLAHGIADNLLTLTALAAACPILIAPAMDGGMFTHPATQANLDILRQRGVSVVGPVEGHLASGIVGIGRMPEVNELFAHTRLVLSRHGPLRGRRIVISAGGTQEPIDPVRAITNRSSGKQGYALAQSALDLGAEVTLISGITSLIAPPGTQRVDVCTSQEMLDAVLESISHADALIMAAAVADFKPIAPASQKIKKETTIPEIHLERTVDILARVAQEKEKNAWPKISIGFAAESQELIENALSKLHAKKLDMIVANDISAPDAGFNVDTNKVSLIFSNGRIERFPVMSKIEVANIIMDRVTSMIHGGSGSDGI